MEYGHVILFGGSFDPIHKGHMDAIATLQNTCPESLVIVMPSKNRLKDSSLIPIDIRYQSVLASFRSWKNVVVVDWTLYRDTSSTYEVVQMIKKLYPQAKITVAVGEDVLSSLPRWKHYDKLTSEINWSFFLRHGGAIIAGLQDEVLKNLVSQSQIIDYKFEELSSTQIRSAETFPEGIIPQEAFSIVLPYLKLKAGN